jgi:hypothetical protein
MKEMNDVAIEVFNRYENKYIIDEAVRARLQARLEDEMAPDAYNGLGTYRVCNLYYDTYDDQVIRASLSSPSYKEKLRLRTYGTPAADSEAFLEIKKKANKLVNKRRSAMPPEAAYAFARSGVPPKIESGMNAQVVREIEYMLARRPLSPKVYIAYERRAYVGTGNSDLRVSFDTNIVTRRHDLRLESGVYGERLMPEDQWLMEIKTARSIPLWLSSLLAEYKIYPQGFSKYGVEYQKALIGDGKARTFVFIPKAPNNVGAASA